MCLFFYFLRQHLPGGQIQLVPLFSREHDICCFCHIRQAFFIHGTDNGLDSGGVAENPGNGDAVWRGVVFLSQAVQDLVELRIFFASDEDSLKHAVLEGGPCLDRDIFQAAVFENAAVPVTARVVLDIDVEACVNGGAMSYGKLDLVDLYGSFCGLIQKLDLHGGCSHRKPEPFPGFSAYRKPLPPLPAP